MIIISHRGNIRGPIPDKENRPSYIDCAIGNGYHVEIDVRSINGELWLGHDDPQYKVDYNWLNVRKDYLWIHCKNVESAYYLKDKDVKYFCHQSDSFTLTSTGHVWVHDLMGTVNNRSIIPLINKESAQDYSQFDCYGVCTDYPNLVKL